MFLKQYLVYLLRWQLSSPILAFCIIYLPYSQTVKTIISNLVGAIIFFWIDRYIFTSKILNPIWETKEDVTCSDCGKLTARGYRLIKYKKYDKTKDKDPQWRCEDCSVKKYQTDLLKNKW